MFELNFNLNELYAEHNRVFGNDFNYVQEKGLKRDPIDKFFTRDDTVSICRDLVKEHNFIGGSDLVIEPCAGNGSFINLAKELSENTRFYDIDPEHSEVTKMDFFDIDMDELKKTYKTLHFIGNPPFGRQSSTAKRFIRRACKYGDTISFILSKSFKKPSMQKVFDKYFHLIQQIDIPDNSFTANGKTINVPCVFQIWKRCSVERNVTTVPKSNGFEYVKIGNDIPDFSVARVGYSAGTAYNDITKSKSSHYFIKLDEKYSSANSVQQIIDKLNTVSFEQENTIGPLSISKPEVTLALNEIIESITP